MSQPSLTADEYEYIALSLRGVRLAEVTYYPLSCGDEGTEVEDWDFGGWQLPTMGVELRTEDGMRYSAVWGQSFDYYGLEIFQSPMSSQLGLIGEPGGSPEVGVTGHPSWAGQNPDFQHPPLRRCEEPGADVAENVLLSR